MSSEIRLVPIRGIPEIRPGDDLGMMIVGAAQKMRLKLSDGDIITVAQKIVSKAEGRLVNLESVTPSEFANEIANKQQRDPRLIEVILSESANIVRSDGGTDDGAGTVSWDAVTGPAPASLSRTPGCF